MKYIILITVIFFFNCTGTTPDLSVPMVLDPPDNLILVNTGTYMLNDSINTCGCSHYAIYATVADDKHYLALVNIIDLIDRDLPLPYPRYGKIKFDVAALQEWMAERDLYIDTFVIDCYRKPIGG